VPCYLGACLRVGGELWWAGRFRLAASLPLRASVPGHPDDVDSLALGSASLELGARVALGREHTSWLAVELGASAPTGTSDAGELDVQRFALAPWYFGRHTATAWLDAALGYGSHGQFAAARLGLLQDLEPMPVTADGQDKRATRIRLGIEGGAQVTPAWLFEAGAMATAALAPRADYLLYADETTNLLGGAAYQLFAGLRGRGDHADLALHLRVPFWQYRGSSTPRPPAHGDLWIFLEVSGRFWF